MLIMSCWCGTIPCRCGQSGRLPHEQKIGELEDKIRELNMRDLAARSEIHHLKILVRELTEAEGHRPRASHAVRLANHLSYGPGLMLESAERKAWLEKNPWPED